MLPDLEKVKQTVSEWKDKSHEEQFAFCEELSNKIREIDKTRYEKFHVDYERRNTMVRIKRELHRELPFLLSVNDPVIVDLTRPVKGVIKDLIDPEMRTVLVRPNDTVYKDDFIVSESMLTLDLLEEAEEEIIKQDEQLLLPLW